MNRSKKTWTATVAALLLFASSTQAITVPSTYDEASGRWIGDVVALTNVLTTCSTWTTVRLEKGIYDISFLTNAPMAMSTYRGPSLLSLKVGIAFIGDTGNRDDVIIKGSNKYRLLEHANGCSIKHMTFTGGHAEGGDYVIAGAICPTGSACEIRNCAFLFNSSTSYGGAVGGNHNSRSGDNYYDCYFYGNVAKGAGSGGAGCGGRYYNCQIISNSCAYNYGGGGGLSHASVVSGCSAISNVSAYCGGGFYNCRGVTGCTVSFNAAYGEHNARGGGMYDCGVVSNCTFQGNAASGFGGAIVDTSAVGCEFLPGRGAHYSRDLTASTNFLEKCDFSGAGISDAAFIDRCRIHHVSNVNEYADNVIYGPGIYKLTYPFSKCGHLRNTLVDHCFITNLANHALFYTDGKHDLLVENCTIVDNNLTYTLRGYDGASAVATFVNTVFYGNYRGGVRRDIGGYESGCTSMTNCFLGVSALKQLEGYENVDTKINGEDWKPRFTGEGDFPYEPEFSSALRGSGKVLDWMDEAATDLAGKARLRDGTADVGAFQCWQDMLGIYLKIR